MSRPGTGRGIGVACSMKHGGTLAAYDFFISFMPDGFAVVYV